MMVAVSPITTSCKRRTLVAPKLKCGRQAAAPIGSKHGRRAPAARSGFQVPLRRAFGMLDDKVLVAALLTVLGWIIVYRLGLHAGRQRALEDLATRRAQLATGLLVELRTLEQFFSRLRADTKPLKSRWHVPCQFFDAKLASLDLLSPASVREAMDLFGIINDIRVFRERYPGPDDATDTNNWFVRVKASVALQRVATLKKALESDGGLLSEGQAVAALTYPALPAIPARAFSQNTLEYDETGAIRLPGGDATR